MALVNPSSYQQLGLPPLAPSSAFQGQINSAAGGGESALANANVAQQTQGARITQVTSDAVKAENDAKQLKFIADTQSKFNKLKGHDGYVSPQTYNQAKQSATHLNIPAASFDGTFMDSYTNPNNAYYDIPGAKEVRAQIQEAYNLASQYKNLTFKGSPEADAVAATLGKVGVGIGGDTRAYKQATTGLASSIRGIVGASQGSGFRFNLQELNRIGDLLPQPEDTTSEAAKKLDILNEELKNSYGIGLEDFHSGKAQL